MADKEKYVIKIQGKLVEVSEDVYYLYFHMERQERTQEEKKQRNIVVSYDALDNGETVGLESMPDMLSPSPEEVTMAAEIRDRLYRAINVLPRAEKELIEALYFDESSTEDYAKRIGMTVRGVNKRRNKVLVKLRAILDCFI